MPFTCITQLTLASISPSLQFFLWRIFDTDDDDYTGLLDPETIKMMNTPRCGNKDKAHTHESRRSKRYALQGMFLKRKMLHMFCSFNPTLQSFFSSQSPLFEHQPFQFEERKSESFQDERQAFNWFQMRKDASDFCNFQFMWMQSVSQWSVNTLPWNDWLAVSRQDFNWRKNTHPVATYSYSLYHANVIYFYPF